MSSGKETRPSNFFIFFQAIFLGVLFGEIASISQIAAKKLLIFISVNNYETATCIICVISLAIALMYMRSRSFVFDAKKILMSGRVDLFLLFTLGLYISTSKDGLGSNFYSFFINKIDDFSLILMVSIPIIIASLVILKSLSWDRKKVKESPFFFSDKEILASDEDLLGLSEQAKRFSERVLNGGSSDSLVFGIDAPWGTGKSSFINLCCECWHSKKTNRIIIHRFEPLRYDDNEDLSKNFINDLITTIQEHVFAPTLKSLISKYFSLVKGNAKISLFGMDFEYERMTETVENALDEIDITLHELDRKIIVIVDDLDRLSWLGVKNILYAIKRTFRLRNVTYILCYDTENFSIESDNHDDLERVIEFLEKFVNVKISLFLDPHDLKRYVSENFSFAASLNLSMDPYTLGKIRETVDQLLKIYDSNEYIQYKNLVGDVRKLKRLINTLMLLEIEKTDFYNSDYNKEDLINLLLIYINYPNIFRRIYDSESNGKSGVFSLSSGYKNSTKEWSNSTYYLEYFEKLSDTKKFLLNKVFPVVDSKFEHNVSESDLHSRARFNEKHSGRSLEKYLNLIIKLSKQANRESYQFYINIKQSILLGKTLENVFDGPEFSFADGDAARDELWRIIANSSREFSPEISGKIIIYLTNHLPKYTYFELENIGAGSRRRLIYSLSVLLDSSGWGGQNRRHNNSSKISEIAEWIFGEGVHENQSILETLMETERGVLGLYDGLIFRLSCSADRGSNLYNLQRALSYHGSLDAPVEGLLTDIVKEEMREISQKVFNIFKNEYIVPEINILDVIDELMFEQLAGSSVDFIRGNLTQKIISSETIDNLVIAEKSRMKIFILYQLSDSSIDSGVGCGFYDEVGSIDGKGIAEAMNTYLFDFCFNPGISPENAQKFIDYLMLLFTPTFEYVNGAEYSVTPTQLTKVVDKNKLIEYWKKHGDLIKDMKLEQNDRKIVTRSYIANYKEDLLPLIKVLDNLISGE